MLTIERSQLELNELSFKRLEEEGFDVTPGAITRLLVSIQNEHIGDFYTVLKDDYLNRFVSTAKDDALEKIGVVFNCEREEGEDDDTLRFRIVNQSLALAKANETSVRLACLAVEGVKDVILKPFTHGTGSFSVYVVTDVPTPDASLLEEVESNLADIKAFGIRVHVASPKILEVEYKVRIQFEKDVADIDRVGLRKQAQQLIKDTINSTEIGGTLSPSDIRKDILILHDGVYEVDMVSFRINGKAALAVDQTSDWNERFVESSTPDSILVS